jgi:hypothetical protein
VAAKRQAREGKTALSSPDVESVDFCHKPNYDFLNCTKSIFDICNYERYKRDKHKEEACQWIRAFFFLAITLLILKIMSRTLHQREY